MNMDIFEAQYKRLNKKQKLAVDTIEGPVMVVAGPGTGKTSILTLRIANILKQTDADPDSILALTFTEAGVQAMRKKLLEIIGPRAHKINIHTFHGFSNGLIQEYPEKFPKIIGASNVSDFDQIKIIEEIIQNSDFKILKPWGDPLYYVTHALSEIKNMKRDGVGAEEFKKALNESKEELANRTDIYHEKGAHKGKKKSEIVDKERENEKNTELLSVYEGYESALRKRKLYDYEDMIVETVKVLRADEDFLRSLQEKYQYILADEHQDANNSQNAILETLSNFHSDPNLFIVGDEKQAIFRFQGASLENFLYFKKIYPSALLIDLEDNYRSTQNILDASHSLIEHNPNGGIERTKLQANSKAKVKPVNFAVFNKKDFELRYVASEIQELIKAGEKPEEIAIIYRENRDSAPIAETLSRIGIPFQVESDKNLLDDSRISVLINLFKAISNPTDKINLAKALLFNFWNIPHISVYKTLAKSERHGEKALHELIRDEKALSLIIGDDASGILDISKKIDSWSRKALEISFPELFEIVLKESGYLTYLLNSKEYLDNMSVLESFYGEVKKMAGSKKEYSLSDFMDFVSVTENHGIYIKGAVNTLSTGKVRLMTAHKSKGLEFNHVYIINANARKWEEKKNRAKFKLPESIAKSSEASRNIEDERRLFYVALTRARSNINITASLQDIDGKQDIPTQFISEIDESLVTKVSDEFVKELESKFSTDLTHHFTRVENKIDKEDESFIKEKFLEQGLSVTHLNNYLKCPWHYFFVNLLRVPQAQNNSLMFGNAVHETLRIYFNKYKEEAEPAVDEMLRIFEFELSRQPILKKDFKSMLERGREALDGYFRHYKGTWTRNLMTEFSIKGATIPLDIKVNGKQAEVLLNGKLDRVEFLDSSNVNVVDYKTGDPKSRNHILGETKDSNGDYFRQLTFYKLLIDSDKKKGWNMVSAEIDFIEPTDTGKYKKEKFEVTESDVEKLIELIKTVSKEIINVEFWDKGCGEKDCEYCKLRTDLKRLS